jgi:ABC-type multidrug transport system fused ATPase/permease subunit
MSNTAVARFRILSVFARILGARGAFWGVIVVSSAILQGMVEASLAIFLQIFLESLGLINQIDIPILEKFRSLSALLREHVLFFLILIGVFRATFQFISAQAAAVMTEISAESLKLAMIFPLISSDRPKFRSSVSVQYDIASLIPNSAHFILTFTNFCGLAMLQITLLVILLQTAWVEALIGLAGLSLIAGIVHSLNLKMRKIASNLPFHAMESQASLDRILKNWILVRVHGVLREENVKLRMHFNKALCATLRAKKIINFTTVLPPLFGIILIAMIISISQKHEATSGSDLLMFVYLFIRFVQNLSLLVSIYGSWTSVFPYFNEVCKRFEHIEPRFVNDARADTNLVRWSGRCVGQLPLRGQTANLERRHKLSLGVAVEFDNATFSWPNSNAITLQPLKFGCKPSDIIGIMGESGSGKSTFISLLLGINEPNTGTVLINEITAGKFLEDFSSLIAYVGPDPFLIPGTIRENLTYGNVEVISDRKLLDVLDAVELLAIVNKLPGGLDYTLSENISSLSTGQKQRIGLARAILREPALLVLDEPTSNLDEATEAAVLQVLASLPWRPTIFIVSHRPSAMKLARRVLKFNKGTVSFDV